MSQEKIDPNLFENSDRLTELSANKDNIGRSTLEIDLHLRTIESESPSYDRNLADTGRQSHSAQDLLR